jgi:glucans biosynthesis protein
MHGGAPRSGAPKSNDNALKHGNFTHEALEQRKGVNELIRKTRKVIQEC